MLAANGDLISRYSRVPGGRPGQSIAWADAFPANVRPGADPAHCVRDAGDGNGAIRQPAEEQVYVRRYYPADKLRPRRPRRRRTQVAPRAIAAAKAHNTLAARANHQVERAETRRRRPLQNKAALQDAVGRANAGHRATERPHRGRALRDHRPGPRRRPNEMVGMVVAGLQRNVQRRRRNRSDRGKPAAEA